MPSITDKFNKAGNGSGTYPVVGIVSANRAANEAILSCEDLTGWATDTPVHFSTYRLAQDGTVDTTSQTDWKGIVNGNTITNLTRIAGANDTGNSVGDYVEINPTIGWLDDIVTGLLASHKQDGTLKDGIVSTAKIADSAVTSSKIDDAAITHAKIADNAVSAENIDWSTMEYHIANSGEAVTITEPGVYYLFAIKSLHSEGGGLSIQKNGTAICTSYIDQPSGQWGNATTATIATLAKDDVVRCVWKGSIVATDNTYFRFGFFKIGG